MVVVIGYAILQAVSGDFKEFMIACSAIQITLYHFASTVWGMLQLKEYKTWCTEANTCVHASTGD